MRSFGAKLPKNVAICCWSRAQSRRRKRYSATLMPHLRQQNGRRFRGRCRAPPYASWCTPPSLTKRIHKIYSPEDGRLTNGRLGYKLDVPNHPKSVGDVPEERHVALGEVVADDDGRRVRAAAQLRPREKELYTIQHLQPVHTDLRTSPHGDWIQDVVGELGHRLEPRGDPHSCLQH